MIEVEAKVKIDYPKECRAMARKYGRFVGVQEKIDDYYTLENVKSYPKKSLRIRRKNNIYEVNFKQKISLLEGVYAKKESEFKVSDIESFLELIGDFGFKKWLRKYKRSEIYEVSKKFHIEINFVKGLGWFLEVEYLANKGEVRKAREKVYSMIRKFGYTEKNVVQDGYTKLLWEKR